MEGIIMNYIKTALNGLSRVLCLAIYYSGTYAVLDAIFSVKGVYIIFYHRLADRQTGEDIPFLAVDKKSFEAQIKFFKSKYRLITMDEAVERIAAGRKIGRDYLVITLDDGYRDNYTYGYPVFRKYDIKPTLYVTAGNVENQTYLWHDRVWDMVFNSKAEHIDLISLGIEFRADIKTQEQKKETVFRLWELAKELDEMEKREFLAGVARSTAAETGEKCNLMLNWDEVKALSEIGVDIGGHTLCHPILARNPEAFIVNEVQGSKKLIESRLNRNINHFSYPNGECGDYDGFTIHEVTKHYKSAATTIQGINFAGEDVYALKRICFSGDGGLTYIKVKLLFIKMRETFGLMKKKIESFIATKTN